MADEENHGKRTAEEVPKENIPVNQRL